MSELFNGTWAIDVERSTVWDADTQSYVADLAGQELITIKVDRGVQHYHVDYGDDPVVKLSYSAAYDSAEWVPYTVRDIVMRNGSDPSEALAEFKRRTRSDAGVHARRFEVGQAYGLVRIAYVDERTHYRLNKSEAGAAQYVMMRRMDEDGDGYWAVILDTDGRIYRRRRFVRSQA